MSLLLTMDSYKQCWEDETYMKQLTSIIKKNLKKPDLKRDYIIVDKTYVITRSTAIPSKERRLNESWVFAIKDGLTYSEFISLITLEKFFQNSNEDVKLRTQLQLVLAKIDKGLVFMREVEARYVSYDWNSQKIHVLTTHIPTLVPSDIDKDLSLPTLDSLLKSLGVVYRREVPIIKKDPCIRSNISDNLPVSIENLIMSMSEELPEERIEEKKLSEVLEKWFSTEEEILGKIKYLLERGADIDQDFIEKTRKLPSDFRENIFRVLRESGFDIF